MSQYIDGKRREALTGAGDGVRDPSNGEVVAEVTLAGALATQAGVPDGVFNVVTMFDITGVAAKPWPRMIFTSPTR